MPVLQNDASLTSSITSQTPTVTQQQSADNQNQQSAPIRETTQTDTLNKVLLKAFLNRLNNGEVDFTFQQSSSSTNISSLSSFDSDSAGSFD